MIIKKNLMTLVKFNNRPIEKSIYKVMDDFFTGFNTPEFKNIIPVNIMESNDAFILDVIAPGMSIDDFKITLENNLLTVSVEKVNETKEDSVKEIRSEYRNRTFNRSFNLDKNIDGEKIEAKYVNGVLTLNLPKKEEVKPSTKQISIQ